MRSYNLRYSEGLSVYVFVYEAFNILGHTVVPSGKSGYCLQEERRFLVVFRCGSLTSMFGRDACDNSLIRRYCCKPCPKIRESGRVLIHVYFILFPIHLIMYA